MLRRVRILVVTFWAGLLWSVGFVAAPTLFVTLPDRMLAGTVAGSLFHVTAWLSLACAAVLALLLWSGMRDERQTLRPLLWLIMAMAVCTLAGYFGLQPAMASLRAVMHAGGTVQAAAALHRFGLLHGVASFIYVVQSVLAAVLVLKMR